MTSQPAGAPEPEVGADIEDASFPLLQKVGFWTGIALFLLVSLFVRLDAEHAKVSIMAAIAILMATWWVTEAVPPAITGLIPLAFFPIFGIMRGADTAAIYGDSIIFLFVGGFFIALAMERWHLHRRIAIWIISVVGAQPHRLALGFTLATGGVSMWMSNTATAMMMTPMGLSLGLLYADMDKQRVAKGLPSDPTVKNFPVVVLLLIAYAASIGGYGTLVGTPTNAILVASMAREFPLAPEISFARWTFFGFPLSLSFLVLTWFILSRFVYPLSREDSTEARQYIEEQKRELGPITTPEIRVLVVFFATALLWIFRPNIEISKSFTIPGWSSLLPEGKMVDDGTVAIAMGSLLFLISSGNKKKERLMDWPTAKKLPWNILLLFGGGFALAEGMGVSGLSDWIGAQFIILKGAPTWVMIVGVALVVLFVTELASNMATLQMALPILASLSRSIEVNPLLLMIPATIAASSGFMMPMGTTTNMIVYGTGMVSMRQMIRAGIYIDILGVILMAIFVLTLALPIFDISPGVFPDWALSPKAKEPVLP